MSPMAVAQYLPAGKAIFDIIVMDEKPHSCAPKKPWGAHLARQQLVVVGDPKQLPPTKLSSQRQWRG